MKRSIKSLLATLVVSLSLAAPVLAGPLADGAVAHERGDYATALRLWRPLAEQGDALIQNLLGNMYRAGEGVPQDYAKAARWHRKAAEQGDDNGQEITRHIVHTRERCAAGLRDGTYVDQLGGRSRK